MKFGQIKVQEFAQKFFSNIMLFAFAFLAVNDLDVQKQRNPVKLHRTSCTCSKQGRTAFYYTKHELKLICRNLYPLFSQVKKSLYGKSEWRTALSRVEVLPINHNVKAFPSHPCISCKSYFVIESDRD